MIPILVRMLRPARRTLEVLFVALALLAAGPASPAAANEDDIYIVQTNAAGDNVHLIVIAETGPVDDPV